MVGHTKPEFTQVPAGRFAALDGWRAISIVLVLAAHMLPLGPKRLELNAGSGYMGMALFFTLSGFLITCQLEQRHQLTSFFVRRLFRILPLAYLAVLVAAVLNDVSFSQILVTLGFAQTYIESGIMPDLSHFWSLCVEVHFYLFIGLLMWATRWKGFLALPVIWALLVVARWYTDRTGGRIHTHLRVDEILSGSVLAMLFLGKFGQRARAIVARVPALAVVVFFAFTCHPRFVGVHALRGFAASLLVGHTLLNPDRYRVLAARPLRYLAHISYALYVIHPFSMHGWLGEGASPYVKYFKRILCFAITFGLAHLSTFYYEQRFINLAKALCRRIEGSAKPRDAEDRGLRLTA